MSTIIDEQINAIGVAQVLVVLKSPPPPLESAATGLAAGAISLAAAMDASPALMGLDSYFTASDLSLSHALMMESMHGLAAASSASAKPTKSAPPVLHFPNLGVMLGTVTHEGLAGLEADERVESVTATQQPSLIKPVKVAAAKPKTKTTWGIEFLQVPKLWNQGLTGKGIRVGHLDTGADGKHPALKTAIAAFAELDSLGVLVTPAPKPHDTGEHGTHTAATIAGRAVNGQSIGVAPATKLASAIVIEGGDVVARILGGMDWAITQNIRVLSMSLGLRGMFDFFLKVTQIIRAQNILPVFAVGNEGAGTSRSPGNYSEPLSVGAIDSNAVVADFSSSQRFLRTGDPLVPDLVGPGVDVISAKPKGGFQSMSGTSMATPHIAGLAALLFEAKPNATVNDVESAIFKSCKLGSIAADRGNRGFPNASTAFTTLTGISLATTTTAATTKKSASKGSSKQRTSTKKSAKKAKRKNRKKR